MLVAEIVIPCFNEAKNIENLILQCREVIALSGSNLGFIIVNNGSYDKTHEVLASLIKSDEAIKYLLLAENQGYGGGILKGISVSTAPIVGWTHADLQTPLVDCLVGLRELQLGKDFAKGVRSGRKFGDKIFSIGMGIFESLLFRLKLYEINAQPTMFKREFMSHWNNPPKDFSLDLYALLMASKTKRKIGRFSVNFLPRLFGESKWNSDLKSRLRFIKRTVTYSVALRRIMNENL